MMSVKCFNPFLSGSVRFSPFLSVSLHFCPFMSVYVPFCLFLSVSLCFCPFLSVWGFVVSFCATIRTCREIQCLLYAGFLLDCCGFRIQMRLVNCPFCVWSPLHCIETSKPSSKMNHLMPCFIPPICSNSGQPSCIV